MSFSSDTAKHVEPGGCPGDNSLPAMENVIGQSPGGEAK